MIVSVWIVFFDSLSPEVLQIPQIRVEIGNTSYRPRTKSWKVVGNRFLSECAKGAAKASCGETVVPKGCFGESVSSLPP